MLTRMQSIGNVFNKFPRVVRDLACSLGKQIELTLEGKDVVLDKTGLREAVEMKHFDTETKPVGSSAGWGGGTVYRMRVSNIHIAGHGPLEF